MKKFTNLIEEMHGILNEEEEPPPPPPGGDEPLGDVPEETPVSAIPAEDEGQDDTAVLKINYVEMIRKALIMAPKHIDDVDYARLTKVVDTENLYVMQELVSRIVKNNYPHSDFEV